MGAFSGQEADYQYTPPIFQSKGGAFLKKSALASTAHTTVNYTSAGQLSHYDIQQLLGVFLSGKKQKTLNAYRQDLHNFTDYLNEITFDEAARILLSHGHGKANLLVMQYKDYLIQSGLSPATINRRLSALRSLVKLSQVIGLISWELQVSNVKSEAFRDCRGVSLEIVKRLIELARSQRNEPKAARDTAIVVCLFSMGLRRSELVDIDYEDLQLSQNRVMVLRKGKNEKIPLTLPPQTKEAILEWLQYRGDAPGALFYSRNRSAKFLTRRLTDNGLYKMIRTLGKKAGINLAPHKLRHSAITILLDKTNGNIRLAQKFGMHSSPTTTLRYDDSRIDAFGQSAGILADAVNT